MAENQNEKMSKSAPGKSRPQDNVQIHRAGDQNRGDSAVRHDVKTDNNKKKNNQNTR